MDRKDASKSGSTFYHGKPCKKGHTFRYTTNGHCVECNRAIHNRNSTLKRYGLTQLQFQLMSDLNVGRCVICQRPPKRGRLVVDHNHKTGQVRGLLCRDCNLMVGHGKDDPTLLRAAAAYLER